jgi:hypothetical protein
VAAAVGLVSRKSFTYRGVREETSNKYWFTGTVPADAAAWRALYDALVLAEKPLFNADFHFDGAYGYADNSPTADAVWGVDMTVPPETPPVGTYPAAGAGGRAPGDSAAWIRWKTSRNTSRGKAIYLRKYYHGVYYSIAGGLDAIDANQVAAYNAFATKMKDGTFIGGRKIRSQAQDETIISHQVSPWITTRTLKRRGKRPT